MLERLFPKWFPLRTLDGLVNGAFVELPVRVESPNFVELTLVPGESAALVYWTLLTEKTPQGSGGRAGRPGVATLARFVSGWRGPPLLVRDAVGRTIELPLAGLHLRAPVDPQDGTPLGSTPRSAVVYGQAAQRAPQNRGLVYVREHAITHAQSLVLRGRVAPVRRVATGYRDQPAGATTDFRTEGEVVIIDEVLG